MKTFLLIALSTAVSAQFSAFNSFGQQGNNQFQPGFGQNGQEPPFLQKLPQEAKDAFLNIFKDQTLSREQKKAAIDQLAAKYGVTLPPKPDRGGQSSEEFGGEERHRGSTGAPSFGQFGNGQFGGFGNGQFGAFGKGGRRSTEAPQFGGFPQNNGGNQGSFPFGQNQRQGNNQGFSFNQGQNQGSFPFGQNQGFNFRI